MTELPNHIAELEGKTQPELLAIRKDLIAKSGNTPSAMTTEDIELFVAVVAMLRRKSSGPPKADPKRRQKATVAAIAAGTPLSDLI